MIDWLLPIILVLVIVGQIVEDWIKAWRDGGRRFDDEADQ